MDYNYNQWMGNPTLYPNPSSSLTNPYQPLPQNPNPNPTPYTHSYGVGHESQGQALVLGYGNTSGGATATSSVEAMPVYYQDPNVLQLLAANQSSFGLGEVAAVSPNGVEKLTLANVNSNFLFQPPRSGSWGRGQRKTKMQPVWCDVCKLEFNSKTVLDQHKLGKKHRGSLAKLGGGSVIIAPTSAPQVASVASDNPVVGLQKKPNKVDSANGQDSVENLEIKKRKILEGGAATDEVRVCLACNVVCNSDTVFKTHLIGKKHIANITKQQKSVPASASLVASVASDNPVVGLQKKPNKVDSANGQDSVEKLEIKKRKILEGGAATDGVRVCLACNVVCNSETVFKTHLIGKKHIANITKQQKSVPASASLVPSVVPVNTFIGPQEKPDIVNSGNGQDAMKKAAELIENLETKTRKVLGGGAATSEVCKCLVCKVVCNSETVFRLHLTGKKHIANMKKQASGVALAN